MKKYSFFLPTRKGSERVANKNTRTFAGLKGGILKIKLQQLMQIERVQSIVISTNDPDTIDIARSFNSSRIKIIERPEHLCLSSTVIEDFINYIPSIVDAEHIFWVHATAPFANEDVLNEALDCYEEKVLNDNEYDSLLSVTKIQQFLWSAVKNDCINHDRTKIKWPRTQDLVPLYEINHAFYINSKENYLKYHDRIGKHPFLYELNKVQSFDIDWEDDFVMAEAIYDRFINKRF